MRICCVVSGKWAHALVAVAQVEQLAKGETTVSQIDNADFIRWLSGFSFIKVIERPIEAWHSRATQITRRCRNASIAYVSLTLRFPLLVDEINRDPQACVHSLSKDVAERQQPLAARN